MLQVARRAHHDIPSLNLLPESELAGIPDDFHTWPLDRRYRLLGVPQTISSSPASGTYLPVVCNTFVASAILTNGTSHALASGSVVGSAFVNLGCERVSRI
jgi:hypothetical protein